MEHFNILNLKVDVFYGPAGSCGFRTGKWPYKYNDIEFEVYASVPHAQSFEEQKKDVTRSIINDLRNRKIIN
ncbi:MAG TPA: hypothetical protein ENH82_10900 [bacterium]|nr:hypothetical protein [bacterium]